MKNLTKLALGVVGVGLVGYLGLVAYVYHHDSERNSHALTQTSASPQNNKVLSIMRDKGCDYCHTVSSDLPFYSSLPVAKQLMNYDMHLGYKSFNLTPLRQSLIDDTPALQSDLTKIEWVMEHQTMPPTRYTALHWDGKMSDEERGVVLDWIKAQRLKYYAADDMAEQHRNEPVQPIPQTVPYDARKAALGFRLYHDPRISDDNSISCASCHQLGAGGVDGRKTSTGVRGEIGPINAPTVFNSVFNVVQFWDGRAPDLKA